MDSVANIHTIRGIGASPGIGIGTAIWRRMERLKVVRYAISEDNVEQETSRLTQAIETAKTQIQNLRESTAQQVGETEAQIFDAHEAFLTDPSYVGTMLERICTEHFNAEAVCEQVTGEMQQMLSSLPDEYLQARAADIRDVGDQLLALISGRQATESSAMPQDAIVIADELAPSDLAHFPKTLAGIVTARGSKTGHVAIMARTLGIPAVFGVQEKIHEISDGDALIVDGEQGLVMLQTDDTAQRKMREKLRIENETYEGALKLAAQNAETADGKAIQVFVNIGNLNDVDGALENGAEGVGLFRTEFLYIENNHWPTEEEQFEKYRVVLERFNGRPVTIRTLDIGGDKELPYAELPREENPFLGLRALRFCLGSPDIFKAQLRALLRASTYGVLWIMFPMVSTIAEIHQAKALLEECRLELQREGVTVVDTIPVGIMVETPAAAVMADVLAQQVDFMSIGTNDLTQYTLAADRGNELVAHLYQSHHPAVLRLVFNVCMAAKKADIPVGVCGELAGDSRLTEVLIGLGVNELSMSARSIPLVKQSVRKVRTSVAGSKAVRVLEQSDAQAVDIWLQENQEEDA